MTVGDKVPLSPAPPCASPRFVKSSARRGGVQSTTPLRPRSGALLCFDFTLRSEAAGWLMHSQLRARVVSQDEACVAGLVANEPSSLHFMVYTTSLRDENGTGCSRHELFLNAAHARQGSSCMKLPALRLRSQSKIAAHESPFQGRRGTVLRTDPRRAAESQKRSSGPFLREAGERQRTVEAKRGEAQEGSGEHA